MRSQALNSETLPLSGRHLIEASAGTGKTYNITQIYLRMLLEKGLKVQEILVVTFTTAATEELKGRIDEKIREELRGRPPEEQAILQEALLNLDEAAIHTIHGFCKRVLTQQAFASRLPFDLVLDNDTGVLNLDAVRDWYRQLKNDSENYLLVAKQWETPEIFYQTFGRVFKEHHQIRCVTPDDVLEKYLGTKKQNFNAIHQESELIYKTLIDTHKDQEQRKKELDTLLMWLEKSSLDEAPDCVKGVYQGNRYSKKPPEIKSRLKKLFTPLKELVAQSGKIAQEIARAKANLLIIEGMDQIQQRIEISKTRQSILDFDDLIDKLLISLQGEQGRRLADEIATQYPVALVDEFQDTDPKQFAVFEKIYPKRDENPLYLIGDPKQAIYGFRKGDIFTYLKARDGVSAQWHMDTNWRSTRRMVDAYNRLFYGQSLKENDRSPTGDVFNFEITYSPVKAANIQADELISEDRALTFIYFPKDENFGKGTTNNQEFRAVIANWCAKKIHNLLHEKRAAGQTNLEEQDIAILVRDGSEAKEIQNALRKKGYSAVYLSNRENVFHSREATELRDVMVGILFLEDHQKMIRALSTSYFSLDTKALWSLQENEDIWDHYRTTLSELRELWLRRGFMVMALKLVHEHTQPDPENKERSITNTLHLLELIQEASRRYRQPWELINWLVEQRDIETGNGISELRLESDENLIRIVTQHGSKGLEYSVVFIPFATRSRSGPKGEPAYLCHHQPQTKEPLIILGSDRQAAELAEKEQLAEDVRLLYVAITRAKYNCYLGVTPFTNYERSPLGLTLKLEKGEELLSALKILVRDEENAIGLIETDSSDLDNNITDNDFPLRKKRGPQPEVRKFKGVIEKDWWLSSFSALTRTSHHGGLADPDRDEKIEDSNNEMEIQQEILRFSIKKGAATGNLLHDVLEKVDFTHPEWSEVLSSPLARFGELSREQKPELIEWLNQSLSTQLSPGPALQQLQSHQTLKECEFYFPMSDTTTGNLNRILQKHRGTNPQSNLPSELKLKGMMHGFIDLIFEWRGQYFLVDYKSTHLGDTFDKYSVSYLARNIRENYYDLQYLIYSLALHRFLKKRMGSAYSQEKHLGGIYYLYLRGMKPGGKTGIFYTRLEDELLVELDQLFEDEGG